MTKMIKWAKDIKNITGISYVQDGRGKCSKQSKHLNNLIKK